MKILRFFFFCLLPVTVTAGTGGPNNTGYVYTDSDEADGPPATTLDLSGGTEVELGEDESVEVDLPFALEWDGESHETTWISSNGAMFFDSERNQDAGDCPGTGSLWAGIAPFWDDLSGGTIYYDTLGQYPYRVFGVEWHEFEHGSAGTEPGTFQAWLVEGRMEGVISLPDITFGDSSVDGGAQAVVGFQTLKGDGLEWSCTGGLSDGTSAWFGYQGTRPGASIVTTEDLTDTWAGEDDFSYNGIALDTGELNSDGIADLLVGSPDYGSGTTYLLYGVTDPGHLADAPARIVGESGSDMAGTSFFTGDVDGDGAQDLGIGAPGADYGGSEAGVVYLFTDPDFSGEVEAADADEILYGADSGQDRIGYALHSPGDINGDGYEDILVGAPGYDDTGTNQGALYIVYGDTTLPVTDMDYAEAAITGTTNSEEVGYDAGGKDLDGDGLAEIVIGSPYNDDVDTNTGKVFVIPGAHYSGVYAATDIHTIGIEGSVYNEQLGNDYAIADADGDGLQDLLVGGANASLTYGTNSGGAYLFLDLMGLSGDVSRTLADATIEGEESSAFLGTTLDSGDVNGDGVADLFVASPGRTASGVTSGGIVYVFTTTPSGTVAASEADHQLHGVEGHGEFGTGLVYLDDWDEDGYGELAASAPYASVEGGSNNGLIALWNYAPSFPDDDGDAFVSTDAGGTDCDDDDATVWPGAGETASNLVDDDCDGWIDDLVKVRYTRDWWEWDLENDWSVSDSTVFGFEEAASGDDVTSLYAADGLVFAVSGTLTATDEVYGSGAVDDLAAQVLGSSTSTLALEFDEELEFIGFQVLDGSADITLTASGPSGTVVSGLPLDVEADDRAEGIFVGLEFTEGVNSLTLDCSTSDGWGIDEIEVIWSDDTDTDGDLFTESEGDCDDTDADVNPDATEDLSNGVDDDCDGVIDAGDVTEYDDEATWSAAAGIDEQVVDFEDVAQGTALSTEYEDEGVTFSDDPEVVDDVDGADPADTQAAQAQETGSGDTLTLVFEEAQPAVAFQVLDAQDDLTYEASAEGTTLYTGTLSREGDDMAGGEFAGLTFDVAVDTLVLTAADSTDLYGIDDLTFSELGLDDADGDGYTESEGDCDDSDASTAPGAEEIWYDGTDQDCDGGSDYDADGDGYDLGTDCDDEDSDVNPDAEEIWYDGTDQDCDGGSDYDADGDGHDLSANGGEDCDDTDADISPDAEETWYDGVDQNCDEDDEYDADGDGWSLEGAEVAGELGEGDCDDTDADVNPDAEEVWYDGIDQDCADDSDYDADGDGQDTDDVSGGTDCDDGDASVYQGATGETCYDGVDTDCDGYSDYDCDEDGYDSETWDGTDCDDDDPDVHPGATDEPGDGVDADCAGDSDYDDDRDGYDGDYGDHEGTDCDDDDPDIHPDAEELCGDGVDSDCDGLADYDCDGDGYDAEDQGGQDCDDDDAGVNPGEDDACYDGVDSDCDGWSDDDCDRDGYDSEDEGGTDCDDDDATVHPDAEDHPYDGIDQDCDDENDYDADGDGFEVSYYGGTDCDDTDADIHPLATDTCYDGVDSDCDEASDYDCDGDGYDSEDEGGTDCDDDDASIHPDATEVCGSGEDEDCDGEVDECSDQDGDGYDSEEEGGTDCDDDDADIHPGAEDTCYDGVDSNCDDSSDYDCDGDGYDAEDYDGTDCDDDDADVNPGTPEIWYDGRDQDCDGADDYDQDGDGYLSETWGGTDCDDTDENTNPGMLVDDCGGGDEDCDDETDEDCVGLQDTADTGAPVDTGDTGEPIDTGTEDTGLQDTGPQDTGSEDTAVPSDTASTDTGGDGSWEDPKEEGCSGCSTPTRGSLAGAAWIALALLGTARRRRGRNGPRGAEAQ